MADVSKDDLESKLKEKPILPVLPLRNTLLFPDMIIPLAVGRDRSLKAVEQATRGEGYLLILSQKDGEVDLVARVLESIYKPVPVEGALDGDADVWAEGAQDGEE